MSFQLRPYQQECLDAVAAAHKTVDSVLVSLPTGCGKTVIFVRYASSWEHGRTMIIAPQIELIGQAANKMRRETGIMPAIEQGDNRSNEAEYARSPYVVASKQTLCKRRVNGPPRYERFKDVGLVIVDEAHTCATDQYAECLAWFKSKGAKILGVTATPKRHDKRAMGQVFDDCVYQYGLRQAIDDGWLVQPKVTVKQLQSLDLSNVQTANTVNGKDFNAKQLNAELEKAETIYEICEAVSQETRGMKTAVYCASVAEAQAVSNLLNDGYGIKADWICSEKKLCSDKRRSEVLKSFMHDEDGVTHVANCGILTTGWDFPGLMAIVMARPTKSLVLHTQILGRGTRPLEGVVDFDGSCPESRLSRIAESAKPHFKFIDLVDVSLKHKIVTATDVLSGRWTLGEPAACVVCTIAAATMKYNGWPCCERCADSVEQRLQELVRKAKEPLTIDEAVKEAKDRQKELEDEKRRAELAKVAARAKFNDIEGDIFGGPRKDVVSSRGVVLATEKQKNYIRYLGIRDIFSFEVSKAQAGRIISQLKAGLPVATVRQQNRLSAKNAARPQQPAPKPAARVQPEKFDEVPPDDIFALLRD